MRKSISDRWSGDDDSRTPPVEYDWEIRAFFRDPDGHLFEISEARDQSG
jgi:catechol 2,3-dioxygenase-like lactoylglutathione lyase family enzyme